MLAGGASRSAHIDLMDDMSRTTTASAKPLETMLGSIALARCMHRVAASQSCFCIAMSRLAMAVLSSWTACTISMHSLTRDCKRRVSETSLPLMQEKATDLLLVETPHLRSYPVCCLCHRCDLASHMLCFALDTSHYLGQRSERLELVGEPAPRRDELREARIEI